MVPKHFPFLFLLFWASTLSAVGQTSWQRPDPGQLDGQTYRSDYFGFSIKIPKGWSVKSEQEKRADQLTGYQEFAGNNADLQQDIPETMAKTTTLLSVSQFKTGAVVPSNPSLDIVAEDITGSVNPTHIAYLSETRKFMKMPPRKHKCKAVYAKQFNGKDVAVLKTKIRFPSKTIKQRHYTFLKDNYALTFILTYLTQDDKRALNKFLNTVAFE